MSKAGAAPQVGNDTAIVLSALDPQWLKDAYKDIGMKEYAGKKHNPLIVKLFSTIKMSGIKDDETPWCAAFVGAKLEGAGFRSTRSAWALDYAKWGVSCACVRGAIGYKKRVNSAGKVIGGHVFFVVGQTQDGKVLALGGNQGNAVSIATYDKRDIVGYRWPAVNMPQPRDVLPILTVSAASAVSEA